MDRQRLLAAWRSFYVSDVPREAERADAVARIGERAGTIRARMVFLARFPSPVYHGIAKRRLEIALGMSLGVHQQLLRGVGILDPRGYNKRVEGGMRPEIKPVRATF